MGKQADIDPQYQDLVKAVNDATANNLRAQSMSTVGKVGLTALGLGAGVRGLVGVHNMLRRNAKPPVKTRSGPTMLSLPYPVEKHGSIVSGSTDHPMLAALARPSLLGAAIGGGVAGGYGLATHKDHKLRRAAQQAAGGGGIGLGGALGAAAGVIPGTILGGAAGELVGHGVGGAALGTLAGLGGGAYLGGRLGYHRGKKLVKSPEEKEASWWTGGDASSVGNIPMHRPAMALAGMGGIALGWKGIDAALNARRKQESKQELDDARSEFHNALMSQYSGPVKIKSAGDTELALELDKLYDSIEKLATIADAGGGVMGMYGMYAAPAAVMTGALTYSIARKRQRRAIIDKALKSRERERFKQSPPEIMAVPEPTTMPPSAGM